MPWRSSRTALLASTILVGVSLTSPTYAATGHVVTPDAAFTIRVTLSVPSRAVEPSSIVPFTIRTSGLPPTATAVLQNLRSGTWRTVTYARAVLGIVTLRAKMSSGPSQTYWRGLVLGRESSTLLIRVLSPIRFRFIDSTSGCGNLIRRRAVRADYTPSLLGTIVGAVAHHQHIPEAVRPGLLVYGDFNCIDSTTRIWVRDANGLSKMIFGPSSDFPMAALNPTGSAIYIAWNDYSNGLLQIDEYLRASSSLTHYASLPLSVGGNLAFLDELAVSGNGAIFLHRSGGFGVQTHTVTTILGSTQSASIITLAATQESMAISPAGQIAVTQVAPFVQRVLTRRQLATKALNFRPCGISLLSPNGVIWLSESTLLINCSMVVSAYQLVTITTYGGLAAGRFLGGTAAPAYAGQDAIAGSF
jgi:hypothetical protein